MKQQEVKLTVEEVLKRPMFQHAEVVGGRAGLSRSVRWVHILETPQQGRFCNGGELVLSTGVGFGHDPDLRMQYLHELIQQKTAGLCLELGEYVQAVTPDLVELADHHRFPLIVFHRPVRFVEITLDLHELIVNVHTETLRTLGRYALSIQRLTLESQALAPILSHFQQAVQGQTFFLPVEGNALFAPAMAQSVQAEMRGLLEGFFQEEPGWVGGGAGGSEVGSMGLGQGVFSISERKQLLVQPVVTMGVGMGVLGVVLFEREADEFLSLTLEYTTTAVAQCLLRKLNLQDRTTDLQGRLLEALLENQPVVEEEVRKVLQVKQAGVGALGYQAVVVEVGGAAVEAASLEDLAGVVRTVFSRGGFQVLLRVKGARLYLLATDVFGSAAISSPSSRRMRLEKALAEVERLARQAFGALTDFRYGVSRAGREYARAYRFFQEAEQAMETAGVGFYEDLGVHRLLGLVREEHVSEAFVEDTLGPLLVYDREHGTPFAATLRAFLDHYDSKQEAADALFISRQTLYQRMEKIRELLGADCLATPEKRLCISVALRVLEGYKKGSFLR
ncbi:PucR family transcriptional regulator [Tumebacillus flagellatus]|uniref:PucR family transcriptional regulator n=1 Tax=Tumebacillus flagellatus TaxID=1157490 RepID=A0A074LIJ1_9BACL|nr:PucR family transcriptional regulator [Tumebacillus flagellatus]KEO80959.1 hypothetical protein EL26_23455 [Tumebacillus flagellatus]